MMGLILYGVIARRAIRCVPWSAWHVWIWAACGCVGHCPRAWEYAQAMRQQAEQAPDDRKAQQLATQAQRCEEQFEERRGARIKRGQDTKSLCVSPTEPDAVVDKLKRGRSFAPAYKPSVLLNEDQTITALAVDASSETNMVAQMLDQTARLSGAQPIEALFDTGYFHDEVIDATLQREVSLLCPAPPSEQCAGQSLYL